MASAVISVEKYDERQVRQRMPAAERKAQIVEKAIHLAADVGPDRMTTEQLAREVQISQAAIFRHFENKNAIWEAVAQRLGEKVRANWAFNESDQGRLFGNLRALVSSHLSTIQKTPALPAILFSRELHSENEQLRQFFTQMVSAFLSKLTSVISDDYSRHKLAENIKAGDFAVLVLSLIQGLALRWSLDADSFDLVDEGERLLEVQIRCILACNQEANS